LSFCLFVFLSFCLFVFLSDESAVLCSNATSCSRRGVEVYSPYNLYTDDDAVTQPTYSAACQICTKFRQSYPPLGILSVTRRSRSDVGKLVSQSVSDPG